MQPDDPEYITGLVLLADVYRQENREKEGIEVQEEVLAYWEANGLATDPETWQTRHLQGWDYMRIGDNENALATFRKNIPASIPPYDVMTSEAIYNALMKLGRYEEALAEIQNALELLSHRIGMDERTFEWGRIQARIGHALVKLKRYDEAEGHLVEGYHQMVTFKKDQPSYDANGIPDARMGVYEVHVALKRTDDANRWAEEQIIPELQKEAGDRSFLSGRYTPESLKAVAKLAGFYKRTDRVAEALNLIEATLEQGKANGWPLNSQSLFSMLDKSNGWPLAANILQDLETLERIAHHSGRTDLAVSIASDVRTQMSKVPDAPKYLPARCEYSLGYYLSLHQKPEDAEQHLREAIRLQMEYDPSLPEVSKTRLRLGIVLLDLKNYVEAEPMLIKYYEQTKEQDKDLATGAKSRIPEALDRLIELYTAAGNSDELEKYRLLRADFPSDQTPSPKEQN